MVGPARVARLSVATEIRVDRVAGRYAHGNSNFGLTQPTTNSSRFMINELQFVLVN